MPCGEPFVFTIKLDISTKVIRAKDKIISLVFALSLLINSSCNLESSCCNFWISPFRWDSRVRVLLYFAPLQISLVLGITWSKFEFNIIKKGYRLLLFCQEQTITKKSQPNRSDSLISLDNSLPVAIKIALTFLVCMFCSWHEHHKHTTIIRNFKHLGQNIRLQPS